MTGCEWRDCQENDEAAATVTETYPNGITSDPRALCVLHVAMTHGHGPNVLPDGWRAFPGTLELTHPDDGTMVRITPAAG